MMLDKDVLSQGFGEQISNLIIGADGKNFNLPMMDMFTKMMVAYMIYFVQEQSLGSFASC